ncbi:nuclear transport factor 2 family protein [Streptomyces sp. NPDC020983]|uniref:nuclear transport factor 2 family protein n=1 Tax=Streptomyces sp. NPDC020983 TaxID=3365106 RepID=UPI0037944997
MTTAHTVAVLGLGRMGGAMAARLAAEGHTVTGWTRSGRPVPGVVSASGPAAAVARADLVLLALFDGAACHQVLDALHGELPPGAPVLNTATVAPAEAAGLARRVGRSYVHAPVLGSVPAAASGTLRILAAGEEDALARARPVLDALGTVHHAADACTAAALKLVANAALAGAVLTLGTCLRQSDALGLPREQVLDVLERGQLGGLTARKRAFLGGGPAPATADFTLAALTKDMDLLAAASGLPLPEASALAAVPADPGADVAAAATAPAPDEAVLVPLRAYARGHATGDPAHFRTAFLSTARVEGMRDGAFVSWTLDDYCALFPGSPAPDEASRTRRVDAVDVHGSTATARMTLVHGPDRFTDVFLLVRTGGGWRIAGKTYHRHAS